MTKNFANNAILRGLNNCSPQNGCKNCVAHWKNSRKIAFTEPSRGMSKAKVEQTSAETLSFRCVCERCRLTRGDVGGKRRKIAFTLAEILITLGIIGVVAAITIPTLITSYQKQVTVTKLKKVYSTLSQAIERAKVDNGDIQSWGLGDLNGMPANVNNSKAVAVNFSEKYIIPYVKNVKSAKYVTPKQFGYDSISNLDGATSLWLGVDAHKYMIVLNDGTVVGVGIDSMNMGTQENRNDVIWAITFFVDLNGTKGPNVIGHDIFAFIIRTQGEAKFMPFSYSTMSYGRALIGCQQGDIESRLCTYVIMSDGWQIKDHYPWKFKK